VKTNLENAPAIALISKSAVFRFPKNISIKAGAIITSESIANMSKTVTKAMLIGASLKDTFFFVIL
jgi:hypothetical protein